MKIRASGLSLFCADSGQRHAPAVVFLHGFPFDHSLWQDQVALLEPLFRVITYDHRGHGQSDVGNGQYIFEDFVDDFFALLDHLHVDRAIVCGLSMGGYMALRAIERCPERFQGLVLCDTRSEADSNEVKLKRAATVKAIREKGVPTFVEGFLKSLFAPSSFQKNPKAVERIRKVMLNTSAESLCGTLIALATRTDTTPALEKIRVPTLILVGDQDPITPPAAAKDMHTRIAGSKLVVIPQASHLSNVENPAVFNQALSEFMDAFRT